jgi:hypothetical protein
MAVPTFFVYFRMAVPTLAAAATAGRRSVEGDAVSLQTSNDPQLHQQTSTVLLWLRCMRSCWLRSLSVMVLTMAEGCLICRSFHSPGLLPLPLTDPASAGATAAALPQAWLMYLIWLVALHDSSLYAAHRQGIVTFGRAALSLIAGECNRSMKDTIYHVMVLDNPHTTLLYKFLLLGECQ